MNFNQKTYVLEIKNICFLFLIFKDNIFLFYFSTI